MYVEKGIVIQKIEDKVLIESEINTGCESCAVKGSCIVGDNEKKRSIWMKNVIEAEIGDTVNFKIEEKEVIFASIILYLLPVIMLITGIIIGIYISEELNVNKDTAAGLSGFIGLFVSFILIKIISIFIKNKNMFEPVLIEIIEKNNTL